MLRALAALLVRKPAAWATVLIVVAATLLLASRAVRVERDDDLLAFLPKSNPDIQVFNDVAKRFGSKVYFGDVQGHVLTDIYDGSKLSHGMLINGPAIVEQENTTIAIFASQRLSVGASGDFTLEI